MAQIWSFIGAGAVQQVGSGTATIPVPSGYASGNLLVICVAASATPSTPTGWTAISTNGTHASAFYKFAGSSESSVSMTLSSGSAVMLAYSTIAGFDVAATYNSSSSATSISTNTQTTTSTYDLLISLFTVSNSSNGDIPTTPTSTTSRASGATALTYYGLRVVDEAQSTAGTSTSRTSTISDALTFSSLAFSFKQGYPSSGSSFFLILPQ